MMMCMASDMAAYIIFNAKTQRIGVCNACESHVIHENIIKKALPVIKARSLSNLLKSVLPADISQKTSLTKTARLSYQRISFLPKLTLSRLLQPAQRQ